MPLSEKQALALNGKGIFGKVTNFAALPSAISHDGETWICLASQGTAYITALFGGTYYPSGQYYSVGGSWLYDSTAYQASLSDVNAGIITDQWVAPYTLANSTWAFTVAKVLATLLSGLSVASGGVISSSDTILQALGKLQYQITNINLSAYALLSGATFSGAISATNLSGTNTGDVAVATSAEIITGTDNVKTVSANGLTSSRYLTQAQAKIYAVATGTNTYAVTFTPAFTAYSAGITLNVLFTNANTGAVTLNVDGLGAKAITKDNITALSAGDIKAGVVYSMTYDGTGFQCDCGEVLNSDNLSGLFNANTARNNLGIQKLRITTGDQSTTSATATDITGLVTSTLAINQRYFFFGSIRQGCNNTGGVKHQITIPAGATMDICMFGNTNASTAFQRIINTTSATLGASLNTFNNASGIVFISGEVQMGSTAGVVQFGVASGVNTQTSTVFQLGTHITVEKW